MRFRLLRVMLNRMIQVLQLLIPYPPQRLYQVPNLLTDSITFSLPLRNHFEYFSNLIIIMVPNFGLYRLRTSHGCFATHDRSRPPQTSGENGPNWVERSRTHSVLVDEGVEGIEVAGFLVVHVGHERA